MSDLRTKSNFRKRLGAAAIGAALSELAGNPQAREAQQDAMTLTMQRLGQGGEAPGLRAARSVLAQISA